jgi:hypothetical protein
MLMPILPEIGTLKKPLRIQIPPDLNLDKSYSFQEHLYIGNPKLYIPAESDLIVLFCFVKSMVYLLEERNKKDIKEISFPDIFCNLFEDYSAALDMSRVPKMRPRTRRINVMCHFRLNVENKQIKLYTIKPDKNIADNASQT